ncbi:MAG: signal recognition particle receptor subunit alpha, partial [Parachlamydiaceae bacterium]
MHGLVSKLSGQKKLTEANIADAVSEVRLALLDADVNYSVAKELVK